VHALQVHVFWQGQHVPGSPFTSQVVAGDAHGLHTVGKVAGLPVAIPGKWIAISVMSFDIYGNKCDRGGATLAVDASGTACIPRIKVVDQDDGSYTVFCKPSRAFGSQVIAIDVRCESQSIQNSPFNLRFALDCTGVAGNLPRQQPSELGAFIAGELVSIVIDGRSNDSTVIKKAEVETLSATVGVERTAPVRAFVETDVDLHEWEALSLGDNCWCCMGTPRLAAPYKLSLKSATISFPWSPYGFIVRAAGAFPPNCVADGVGLEECSLGMCASFTVLTRDMFGNATDDCLDFNAQLQSPSGTAHHVALGKAKAPGEYIGAYSITYAINFLCPTQLMCIL
jgi:hypothetical protein